MSEPYGWDAYFERVLRVLRATGADVSETHREGRQATAPAGVAAVPTVDAAVVLSREALARRVALLEGLLREVQHHAHWGTCSVCGWHRDHGHAPDCRLAAALADGG